MWNINQYLSWLYVKYVASRELPKVIDQHLHLGALSTCLACCVYLVVRTRGQTAAALKPKETRRGLTNAWENSEKKKLRVVLKTNIKCGLLQKSRSSLGIEVAVSPSLRVNKNTKMH